MTEEERLREELDRALRVLREVEWKGGDYLEVNGQSCPSCGRYDEHDDRCQLAEVLEDHVAETDTTEAAG